MPDRRTLEPAASALPVPVAGLSVSGVYLPPHVGYRHRVGVGAATNGQPDSMYGVSGTNTN